MLNFMIVEHTGVFRQRTTYLRTAIGAGMDVRKCKLRESERIFAILPDIFILTAIAY